MGWLLGAVLSNVVIATAMALVVFAPARLLRQRPAVVYALWLVVLLKFVTPPLITIPLSIDVASFAVPHEVPFAAELSRDIRDQDGGASGAHGPANSKEGSAARGPHEARGRPAPYVLLLIVIWIFGSLLWMVFAAVRIARFSWLLRAGRPCCGDLAIIAGQMARKLGLKRTPAVVTVDARIPPLVWCAGRASRIVLPRELLVQSNREQLELLLTHELAHIKRRDHWVRWFTLAVLAMYWWHPVAWWAIRRLRAAEEQCCDAMVVAAFPGRTRAYAEVLWNTLEFLAARFSPSVPSTGISSGGSMKRRCEMILNGQTKFRTGRIAGLLLLLTAIGTLPLATVVRSEDKSEKKSATLVFEQAVGQQQEAGEAQRNSDRAQQLKDLKRLNERLMQGDENESLQTRIQQYTIAYGASQLAEAGFDGKLIKALIQDRAKAKVVVEALNTILSVTDKDERDGR